MYSIAHGAKSALVLTSLFSVKHAALELPWTGHIWSHECPFPLTNVTHNRQVAKVYLSIYSDETGKEVAMAGLRRLEG
jgi:hypothetical protein